jgi:hypothetical protein
MNTRQKLMVVLIDVLILAELTVAMIVSSRQSPDDMAGAFIRIFIPAVVVTLIVGRVVLRKLRNKETEPVATS